MAEVAAMIAAGKSKGWLPPVGIQDFLVAVSFLSLVAVQLNNFAQDPGVGWHLSTGEYVLTEGRIPREDPFLHSTLPRPWIADQWLGSTFLYALFEAGSWPLLYAVLTVIYLATYAGVLYRGLCVRSGSCVAASLGAMFAFKIGQIHFILRPVMFSFLFFAVTVTVLQRLYKAHKNGDLDPALSCFRRAIIGLPLLFAVWANVHPSFVLGLGVVGLLPLSILLDRLVLRLPGDGHCGIRFWLLFAACCLATLINPYGYELHESIAWLSQSKFAMSYYMEWQALDFHGFEGRLFEFPLLIIAVMLLIGRPALLGWRFFDVLPLLAFAHFSLGAVRMLPFFGIVAALSLAECFVNLGHAAFWEHSKKLSRLRRAFGNIESREKRSTKGYFLLAVLSLFLVGDAVLSGRVLGFEGGFGPRAESYPFKALEALKKSAFDAPAVVANRMDWGGFVTFYGGGKIRAIIDDRTAMLGEEFYREYFEKMRPGADWQGYLANTGATHVLLESKSRLADEIKKSGHFPVFYEDELAVVFEIPRKPR